MVTEQQAGPVPGDRLAEEQRADRQLKGKHRAMWALGDYPLVADTMIPNLGAVLVDACGISAGDRVLDVGAGPGNAALPAARLDADVVASDLTPELLATGRDRAHREGLRLEWQEADAESMPWPDDSFDVVMSCVGVMFAPHHAAAAAELARVARRGGRIGLVSWTPEGFIGETFAAMKPFVPAPPPGVQPPPRWGTETHLAELLGPLLSDVTHQRREVVVDAFDRPEGFREFAAAYYGPTLAAYRNNADDPARTAEFDAALDELVRRYADERGAMRWEYLLTVGTVA